MDTVGPTGAGEEGRSRDSASVGSRFAGPGGSQAGLQLAPVGLSEPHAR